MRLMHKINELIDKVKIKIITNLYAAYAFSILWYIIVLVFLRYLIIGLPVVHAEGSFLSTIFGYDLYNKEAPAYANLEERRAILKELNKSHPPVLPEKPFDALATAKEIYAKFLQNKEIATTVRIAALNSLPSPADYPMLFQGTIVNNDSNVTQVKLCLYAIALDLEGIKLTTMANFIAIYDLYISGLDLSDNNEALAKKAIVELPKKQLNIQAKACYDNILMMKQLNNKLI